MPAGRPPGAINKHKPMKAALERFYDPQGKNPRAMDELAQAAHLKAIKGDIMAIQFITERLDGKVPQTVGQSDEHGAISIVVTGVRRAEDIIDVEPNVPLKLVSNDG